MKILQTLNRFYVTDMNKAVFFYENLFKHKCDTRFEYAELGLELACLSNILIIGGSEEALKQICDTNATFLVDSILEFKDFLLKNGATIIKDLKEVPTGINMTVRHLDGTLVEYVEHKKQ